MNVKIRANVFTLFPLFPNLRSTYQKWMIDGTEIKKSSRLMEDLFFIRTQVSGYNLIKGHFVLFKYFLRKVEVVHCSL